MFRLSQAFRNQKGVVPLPILITIIGVVVLLAVASNLPVQDRLLSSLFPKEESRAATGFPAGFSETRWIQGLSAPTAMEFSPDGRLFVAQQGGQLRVIKNGQLLATPFAALPVISDGERGLLGIAFDPNFASNQFVYVYYTISGGTNRISRLTANGDVAVAGSEQVLVTFDPHSASNHNGGAMHFGKDGKLYVATGDNALGSNAQVVTNRHGKLHRFNTDGSIPADNPGSFDTSNGVLTPSGANRSIWAVGLRNPFTFDIQPGTGRIFVNDVGDNGGIRWEEINDVTAGSNLGWPVAYGNQGDQNAKYKKPVHTYQTPGCAITGGSFYNPPVNNFPSQYIGKYFYADYCGGFINMFDPQNGSVTTFASGISSPVDIKDGPDGGLYYLARGDGSVYRVTAGALPSPSPAIPVPTPGGNIVASFEAENGTLTAPFTASGGYVSQTTTALDDPSANGKAVYTFNVPTAGAFIVKARVNAANGNSDSVFVNVDAEPTNPSMIWDIIPSTSGYELRTIGWRGVGTTTAPEFATKTFNLTAGSHTLIIRGREAGVSLDWLYVERTGGTPVPSPTPVNTPPTATITAPVASLLYSGGDTINFSGSGTDAEDGTLTGTSLKWVVKLHHDEPGSLPHDHPVIGEATPVTGTSGSFIVARDHSNINTSYIIELTATDSDNASTTVTREINPKTTALTLATSPAGLQITVNGVPKTASHIEQSVVGANIEVGTNTPQTLNATTYNFASWSDGGSRVHTITAPSANTTYTATFNTPLPSPSPAGAIDLVVTDVAWSPTNPTAGMPVTFSTTVKNQGSAATPQGTIVGVLFSVDGVSVNWSDTYTQSVAPGASVTLTANGGPNAGQSTWQAVAGPHSVAANVDDINRINETNEANNIFTGSLNVAGATASPAPSSKPGDVDGNGKVDIFDYNELLTNFGKTGPNIQGDLDKNGKVDIFDYNELLTNFGK